MRKHYTPWTPDEDAVLTRRYLRGDSYEAIGREVGRTREAVNKRRKALGLPARQRRDWQPEEEVRLAELVAEGLTTEEIAQRMGRSYDAIRNALRRQQLKLQKITWGRERLDELERLLARGWSFRQCGEHFGCTREAVSEAAYRTGMKSSASSPAVQAFTPERIYRLRELIEECVDLRRMNGRDTTRYLNSIGEEVSNAWVNRQIRAMGREVRRMAKQNANRTRSLRLRAARRRQGDQRRSA